MLLLISRGCNCNADLGRLTAIVAVGAVEAFCESIIARALFYDALFESLDVIGDIATGNQSGDRCEKEKSKGTHVDESATEMK